MNSMLKVFSADLFDEAELSIANVASLSMRESSDSPRVAEVRVKPDPEPTSVTPVGAEV